MSDASLVSGVGAIATSSNAANAPSPSVSTQRLTPVLQHHHIAGFEVRGGMLDGAEVVSGVVVEAVRGHASTAVHSATRNTPSRKSRSKEQADQGHDPGDYARQE